MKQTITLIILFIGLNFYAQTIYEKGYIITLDGQKIEGLFKNLDWNQIPVNIYYKTEKSSKIKTISRNQITNLKIENKVILERHTVNIEVSKNFKRLSSKRNIEYTKKSLLLKVIVDGKAKLLKYFTNNRNYFFYKTNQKIEPLEFKKYKSKNNIILTNFNYKKTLRDKLNCKNKSLNSNINYNESALIKYFVDYNKCNNSKAKIYSNTNEYIINFRGKLSIGVSKVDNNKNVTILKVGAELEYIFPFKNNKWAVFIEPTYHSGFTNKNSKIIGYKTEQVNSSVIEIEIPIYENIDLTYKIIEIPLSIRKYFILNKKSKLFINTGITFNIPLGDDLKIGGVKEELETNSNFHLGLGFNLNKKISLELRHNFNKKIVNSKYFNYDYNNTSLKIGYNFL